MEDQNNKSLQILAKTWSKDTHGLFDYEIIDELNSNNFTVTGSGSIIRENDEVKNKDTSEMIFNKDNLKIRELCKYSFDEKENSYYMENYIEPNLDCTEENITKLENKLWFVTQAIDKKNLNYDYTEAYKAIEDEKEKADQFLKKALKN